MKAEPCSDIQTLTETIRIIELLFDPTSPHLDDMRAHRGEGQHNPIAFKKHLDHPRATAMLMVDIWNGRLHDRNLLYA